MELSFWAATDVGKKREINEDNFLVDKKLSLFVVADGMGGHASGEVASKLAVHEFRNAVESGRESIDKYSKGDPTVRPQDRRSSGATTSSGPTVFPSPCSFQPIAMSGPFQGSPRMGNLTP